MTPADCRLYAGLMRDECWRQSSILYGNAAVGQEYRAFLRAQVRDGVKHCPYRLALEMIEARA